MPSWQPEQYLLFEAERTQPCRDLVARITLREPERIVDLGCGPGTSTAVLAERWPGADLTGVDLSHEMLRQARLRLPSARWMHMEISRWAGTGGDVQYDVVFSNAALQWADDHASLLPALMDRVAPGGVLALQVPAEVDAPAHAIMRQVASSPEWRSRFSSGKVREWFVHSREFYYDVLSSVATAIEIWTTEYLHVMPAVESIAEWYRGTGMRPFLDTLGTEEERSRFIADYTEALRPVYSPRSDGRVLFPFRRLFLIARH
jgi:trans-aconitate 2-methyltransferase